MTWVKFQSHAGSIEAHLTVRLGLIWAGFQSHAGSIEARSISAPPQRWRLVFQSHAGSIEALKFDFPIPLFGFVSIPRWFD